MGLFCCHLIEILPPCCFYVNCTLPLEPQGFNFRYLFCNHHYENEKFAQIGNSSELGCHGSNADGERPGLYQATSSAAWKHGR